VGKFHQAERKLAAYKAQGVKSAQPYWEDDFSYRSAD
jgi:hypothetical protein